MEERSIYLKEVFAKNGFSLSEKQVEQFELFYDMLIKKNKVMNLTAITEYREVVVKHFLDSVFLAKYVDFSGGPTMIDVGTGAGFPGNGCLRFFSSPICVCSELSRRESDCRNP